MSKMVEESSSKNQRFLKKEKQRRNSDRNLKCQQQKNCNNKGLKKIIGNIFYSGLKKVKLRNPGIFDFFFLFQKRKSEIRKLFRFDEKIKFGNSVNFIFS